MYSENTIIRLNAIAHHYRGLILNALKEVLSQPRFVNTGAAVSGIRVEVVEGNASKSPELQIYIADYMLLLNKSRLQWTKLADVRKLMAWAQNKEFSTVPGYSNPRAIDQLKAAKRVAYAIAVDKKKNDTWKPKKWRKKSLSAVLQAMNKDMLKEFDAAVTEDINDAIKRAA